MTREQFIEHVRDLHLQNLSPSRDAEDAFLEGIAAAWEEINDPESGVLDGVVGQSEQLKCEMCGKRGVKSSQYCPNCSWHHNPIP